MALITAAELKASREAEASGVDDVSDEAAAAAITEAEAELYERLGFRIEDSATSVTVRGDGSDILVLPSRVRSLASVTQDGSAFDAAGYYLSGDFHLFREHGAWTAESIVLTGTFGYTSADQKWTLAKRAVKLLAVRNLQGTEPSNLPAAPGGRLTAYTSENAAFTFDEATGDTGIAEVDRIIDLLGPMNVLA